MANESGPSMEEIAHFRVTPRSGQEILHFCNLHDKEITNLPPKAVVLEIGSGLHQELAEHLKNLRPDITTVSLDPTLGITSVDGERQFLIQPSSTGIEYEFKKDISPSEQEANSQIHQNRLREASQKGGLAALAQNLPLKDDTVNLVIDSFGPGTWFCTEPLETKDYLFEIIRVLKPNGAAIIFPIDSVDEFVSNQNAEDRKKLSQKRLIPSLLDSARTKNKVFIRYFQKEVPRKEGGFDLRQGVKLTKR